MSSDLVWIIILSTVCAASFSFTDSLAAIWAKEGSNKALLAAIILAPVSYIIFGFLNLRLDLARAGGLVNSLVVLLTAGAAIFYFKEDSLQWWQYTGLGLIVIGIFMALYSPAR